MVQTEQRQSQLKNRPTGQRNDYLSKGAISRKDKGFAMGIPYPTSRGMSGGVNQRFDLCQRLPEVLISLHQLCVQPISRPADEVSQEMEHGL